MNIEILLSLGLTRREAESYYILLQTEEFLASKISEKTKESRTNTYDTLNSLIKKGLVSYVIKTNKKHFMATDPKYLLKWMDLRKDEIAKQKEIVENMLPDLRNLRRIKGKKTVVEVFEGKEGWRNAMLQTIEDAKKGDKKILMMSALARELQNLDPIFQQKYYLLKREAKIKTKYIFVGKETFPESPNAEYKFLPDSYKSMVATSIHGNSVIFWLKSNPLIAIVIKSEDLAISYRSNFEELWKIATK